MPTLITCLHIERQKHFAVCYKLHIALHPVSMLGDDTLVPLTDVIGFLEQTHFQNQFSVRQCMLHLLVKFYHAVTGTAQP